MTARHPILIVDEDADLRRSISKHIADDGMFAPTEACSIGEAEAMLIAQSACFVALVVGVVLPDGDGCDLCAALRQRGFSAPILMLADPRREAELVRGFDSGANDYIAKPVRAGELLARLRAHLRSFESSDAAVFGVGPYVFRPSAKLLHEPVKNRRIWLTDKETRILRLLYKANGKPVSRKLLLDVVWDHDAVVTTHTLETHIYRLRQKIDPGSGNARLLTSAGGGYCLNVAPMPPVRVPVHRER